MDVFFGPFYYFWGMNVKVPCNVSELAMNQGKLHHCTAENCNAVFKKKIRLKNHLIKAHQIAETPVKCNNCDLVFETSSQLSRHKKVHQGYKCDKCASSFKTWSDVRKHYNTEHRIVATKCGGCRKKFMSKEDLSNHYADCPKKDDITCKYCSRMFVRPMNVKIHIRTVHEKQRDFVCFVCNKAFLHAHNHANHLANCIVAQERGEPVKESSSEGVTCSGCGKYLLHKRSWWRHKKRCNSLKQLESEKSDEDFSGSLGFEASLIASESIESKSNNVACTVAKNAEESASEQDSFLTVSELGSEVDESQYPDPIFERPIETLIDNLQTPLQQKELKLGVPPDLKFPSQGVHKSRKFTLLGRRKRMRIYHSLVETLDQHQRFGE